MKNVFRLLSIVCFIFSLTALPSGCNKDDTGSDKNRTEVSQQQFDTGEKPYDKDAEMLAGKYKEKSAIAIAQLKRGVDFARANGVEKLIDILKNPSDPRRGSFVSGDFYIWILKTDFKSNAIVSVHPINKAINDRDFFQIKDADGKMFIKDILRIASYKDKGWVSYKWAHPKKKKAMEKLTYFVKINDYVLNDGFYLKD